MFARDVYKRQLQRFGKKRVLYDHQLDVAFETLATQRRSLLGVQSLDVRNVKVRILVELLGEAVNDLSLIHI